MPFATKKQRCGARTLHKIVFVHNHSDQRNADHNKDDEKNVIHYVNPMPDIHKPRFDSHGNVPFAITICVSHFFIFPASMPGVIVNKACRCYLFILRLVLPVRLE
jgi:hypothetical protein